MPDLRLSGEPIGRPGLIPADDRFGERRKSPVSKPRIPLRQANVMLFSTPKRQIIQAFSPHAAGSAENCLG
jgi:hypothetical protein